MIKIINCLFVISSKYLLGFHSLLPAKYEFYKHQLGISSVLDIYVRQGQMDVDHQKLPIQT